MDLNSAGTSVVFDYLWTYNYTENVTEFEEMQKLEERAKKKK